MPGQTSSANRMLRSSSSMANRCSECSLCCCFNYNSRRQVLSFGLKKSDFLPKKCFVKDIFRLFLSWDAVFFILFIAFITLILFNRHQFALLQLFLFFASFFFLSFLFTNLSEDRRDDCGQTGRFTQLILTLHRWRRGGGSWKGEKTKWALNTCQTYKSGYQPFRKPLTSLKSDSGLVLLFLQTAFTSKAGS